MSEISTERQGAADLSGINSVFGIFDGMYEPGYLEHLRSEERPAQGESPTLQTARRLVEQ